MQEINKIKTELNDIRSVFQQLLKVLPSFDIANETLLPYGLKPHTRSVAWIVEQVISQQTKFQASSLGINDVKIDMPDTSLHDCEIYINDKPYYINIKVHNAEGRENKNDIAAVEKLYMQYHSNEDYNLIYACFGIKFDNVHIKFDPQYLSIFSAQFLPVYVNPRNDKIQAFYNHTPIERSREDFLKELRTRSKSIKLT